MQNFHAVAVEELESIWLKKMIYDYRYVRYFIARARKMLMTDESDALTAVLS